MPPASPPRRTARRAVPDPLGRAPRLLAALAVLLVGSTLVGCGLFDEPGPPEPVLPPPPERNIAYGPVTGCGDDDSACGGSQELDIYRSDQPGPNPVLVFVHGGGFVSGDKSGSIPEPLQAVLDDGWDIVSVNYRLATQDGRNQFPTGLRDVQRSVRWIKANAAAQDWDAENVAAMGSSAGGNLVGMLATTADEPALTPSDLPAGLGDVDPSVIAVIPISAVSDLAMFGSSSFFAPALAEYIGCTEDCSELLTAGSVQTHVDPGSAPMLAVHGALDDVAAPEQGELVGAAYADNGIEDRFELIVVDDGPESFQGHQLQYARFADRFIAFLDQHRSG